MTAFWLIGALLVALAGACALLPLWRQRAHTSIVQSQINTRIFRERLRELDLDLREQRIEADHYAALRAELERTLLNDAGEATTGSSARSGYGAALAASTLTVAVLALALGYYYTRVYQGPAAEWLALQERYQDLIERAILQPDSLPDEVLADLPAFTRVLQTRVLRAGMDDPDSLFLLGASLLQLQAPHEAAGIFQRAYQLAGQRLDIAIGYAQSLIFANGGKLEATSEQLLRAVLTKEPGHQGARMILGLGAFNAGNHPLALEAWRALAAELDPASEAAHLLQDSIARAETALRGPPAIAASGESASIAVTVDLAPELRAQLAPDAVLFVFAKAEQGPPMPLAVVRRPARDFPVQIILDDSTSMTPALTLSQYPRVIVSARVSKTGDVAAKPGDLEGQSQPLDLTADPMKLSLMVDRVIGTKTSSSAAVTSQAPSPAQIAVTVDIAPALRTRLPPDATLFIFAKAASGPPMPLAAVRQQAAGFPVQVVLDDSKAVTPALKLSDFQEVVVGARISQAGDVTVRSGDLEASSAPLRLTGPTLAVQLTIDRVVP